MASDAAGRGTAEALEPPPPPPPADAPAAEPPVAEAAAKPSAMFLLCEWPRSLAKACMMELVPYLRFTGTFTGIGSDGKNQHKI